MTATSEAIHAIDRTTAGARDVTAEQVATVNDLVVQIGAAVERLGTLTGGTDGPGPYPDAGPAPHPPARPSSAGAARTMAVT